MYLVGGCFARTLIYPPSMVPFHDSETPTTTTTTSALSTTTATTTIPCETTTATTTTATFSAIVKFVTAPPSGSSNVSIRYLPL